jgi:transcriptional regulator with XRE-family HTH domain
LGLSRNSITQYEADRHLPGADVLAGLDQIGADSHYILTGRRVNAGPITLDLDQMAIALQEARRQLGLPNESQGQREILNRAWIIYLALGAVLNLPTSKGSDSSDEFLAERKNSPRTAASAL